MTTNQDLRVLQHGEIRLLSLNHGSTSKNLHYILKRVKLTQPPTYHALSYCWGAAVADSLLKVITVDGGLKKVRPTLYSFLKEMAVHNPGILIWIDSICIDQNNVVERNQQVSIMADIYRSAETVYVWLGRGDEDTNYAIEHIRDCNPQTEFVSSTFSECVGKLFRASYWTRRWVIQEFALAEKLVVACGKQRTTWHQITKKIAKSVLLEDGTAWKTFQSFEDLRDADQRKDLKLLQLIEKFQHSRCVDLRDKAFALRSIARDGQQLAVKYDESFGDLYFRILSILPTEWILPVMTGYRWPHQAAKGLIMSMKLTKSDLLTSLSDSTDDLIFTVFEYVGKVVKVEDCSQDQKGADECGAFFWYPRQVQIQGSTARHLYGRKIFKAGDDVYTLQSTTQSPKGLCIALASDRAHRSVVGLLLDEPHSKAIAYWQNMQLTEQSVRSIEETLIFGVTKCIKNVLADSCRVLCHISRKVFVLLWLLDIGQIQHLYDHERSLSNPEVEKEPLCCCLRGSTDSLRLSEQNTASYSDTLEILPNIPTSNNDEQWKAASMQPWSLPTIPSLPKDHESHESVWQILDAVDFRAYGRTGLCYAAREGYAAFITDLLSKLAGATSRRGDLSQRTLPLSYGDNYSEVQKPSFYTDRVDPNEADDHGRTALSWAAARGHETALKLLLNTSKIKPDAKDNESRTPLSWAAEAGHEAVVRLLVERDDVTADSKDNYGQTPLSRAAEGGHEAVVRMLVERDDVVTNSKGTYGPAPLLQAAKGGHEAVVRLLVERDDVIADSKDDNGRTPLWEAAKGGHEAVVRLLVERDDVIADSKDNYGRTPLSEAVSRKHEAVVRLLVERDDVIADSKDDDGRTPLWEAAKGGHEAIVRLLVERDDVVADSKDTYDQTPLLQAAEEGHEAVVRLLVERDDVAADSKDNYGQTPLLQAAKGGHEAVVRLLVERDDVIADSKDDDGRTPLWEAAKGGHEAVVRLLVERDDVTADSKDNYRRTPLWEAATGGHEAVVRLLVERDDVAADSKEPYGQTPMLQAAKGGHEAVVRLLVERDDVVADSKDDDGRTPLWEAAQGGHEAVVRLLVERDNVIADSKDNYGRTPLLEAALKKHEAVVRLLVERDNVVTDSKGKYGQTPLSRAVEEGHEAVVRLLVERDDVAADSKDDDGGNEAVVKLLRSKYSQIINNT